IVPEYRRETTAARIRGGMSQDVALMTCPRGKKACYPNHSYPIPGFLLFIGTGLVNSRNYNASSVRI
ncbi:MAG: hypothetical protein OEZ04_06970, partial [Nitrospinota bacterium]|nr:hypothetical protein [Nitrospinota bacterium]